MRLQGKITKWNDDKGFGFVTQHGEKSAVFIHISAFTNKPRRPAIGDIITYEIGNDKNGRRRAEQVRYPRQKQQAKTKPSGSRETLYPFLFTVFFLLAVFLAACLDRISWLIVLAYCVVSPVSYISYAIDKSAARAGKWRTPESQLHLLGFLCGWPGSLAAQRWLRHKTSKQEFQFAFWFTVFLNVSLVGYMAFLGNDGTLNQMLNGLLASVF